MASEIANNYKIGTQRFQTVLGWMDALQMMLSRVSNWLQTFVWVPCQSFDLANEDQIYLEPIMFATNAAPDAGTIGSR